MLWLRLCEGELCYTLRRGFSRGNPGCGNRSAGSAQTDRVAFGRLPGSRLQSPANSGTSPLQRDDVGTRLPTGSVCHECAAQAEAGGWRYISGAGIGRSHRSAERRMRSVDPALPSSWRRASPSRHPCGFQEQTATGGDAPCRCRTPFTCPSSTPGAAREKISCLAWIPVPRPEPPAGEDNWIGP